MQSIELNNPFEDWQMIVSDEETNIVITKENQSDYEAIKIYRKYGFTLKEIKLLIH